MSTQNIENDVAKYSKIVYRIAMSIVKNKGDAEDIFQEVFIKLYKCKKNFENEDYKKAWLIRVTINQCRSLLRKNWFKNLSALDENYTKTEYEMDNVYNMVKELPEKYRIVIVLYYYEKYKESEIAEILHTSEGAIKSRLFRARNMLKQELGGLENE